MKKGTQSINHCFSSNSVSQRLLDINFSVTLFTFFDDYKNAIYFKQMSEVASLFQPTLDLAVGWKSEVTSDTL